MSPTQTFTDNELIVLMAQDNREAFTQLYQRYWDKIFAVAMHRLDDVNEAEEIVQEIFLSLWARRKNLQLTHGLNTYLSVAVKYKVINHLASRHRRQLQVDELINTSPISHNTTNEWFDEKELRAQLEKTISQLPEKCRIVFLLSRDENKTYAEIAAELNISQKTVEAHMSKALSTLRQSLKVAAPLLLLLLQK
ncbi:MAG: RNA polymerase sigma-70 factor [Bacteroidota bacterium]